MASTLITGLGLVGTSYAQHALKRGEHIVFYDVAPRQDFLAHKLGGVLEVYDRAEYLPERAAAMAAWDSKLRELLALTQETKPARKAARARKSRVLTRA